MSESALIKSAIDELGSAFQEFKKTNDERLDAIEKNKDDPLYEEKISRLNNAMDIFMTQIDTMNRREILNQRPSMDYAHDSKNVVRKALSEYVFHGRDNGLRGLELKRLHTGTKEDGGVFLPEQVVTSVHDSLKSLSPVRSVSDVIQTSFHQYECVVDDGSHQALWSGELSKDRWISKDKEISDDMRNKGSATPQMVKRMYPLFALIDSPRISSSLIEDAMFDVYEWMVHLVSQNMARTENHAFIHGDGTNMPQGLIGANVAFSYQESSNKVQMFSTGSQGDFAQEDPEMSLMDISHSLRAEYISSARWMMPRSVLSKVRKMKNKEGHYLWHPNLSTGTNESSLLGYPISICDDLPDLKNNVETKSVLFGDFKNGYIVIDRLGTTILQDPYSAKPDIDLMIRRRVGAGYKDYRAIKCLHFGE